MPRVTNAVATRKRRKRVLKMARGYFGNKSRLYRYAKEQVYRAGKFAYRDRKKHKTQMRQLWIIRLNAACRELGMQYCRFIAGLRLAQINLDRKSLSEMAINDHSMFKAIVEKAKASLCHGL
ncbi:MAG: 50S ribosomal protein L20 [Puniceicoccales bacterium]|jgi:large subunit ribosomal protein L20|nr:50S ribosomal protein L20 [Puniceicoccales bacterium]